MDRGRDHLKEKIIDTLRESDQLVYSFRKQIENKRAFIFIGLTKSGKTTLVKYIRDQPLTAFQHGSLFKIKDDASSDDIGHSSVSNTTVPSVYDCDTDAVIIDAPGFDDNRGALQEIVNSLYINQIKYAREVKFILVSDINDIINDNISNFINSVQTLQTILPNFDQLKQGVAVIFTKDNENYTRQEVADTLNKKILQVEDMKCNKNLIKHLVNSIDLIGLFKMPTVDGVLRDDIDDNIKNAIHTAGSINLNAFEIKYGISMSARNVLYECYISFHEIVENIDSKFNDFKKITSSKLNELVQEEFLIELLDSELDKSVRVLESFMLDIKEVESSKCIENIPNDLKDLFIGKFSSYLKQLKNIISVDETKIVNEKSIDEISRKIDYVKCIEFVIELCYKTNNILKLYSETLIDLQIKITIICKTVKNEIDIRSNCNDILPKLLESEMILSQLDNDYFSASTFDELSKIKQQLEFLLNLCEHYNSEISKRPTLKQTLTRKTSKLLSITECLNDKQSILNNVIETETKNKYLSHLSLKEKSFLGTIFVCAGVFGFTNFKVVTLGASLFLLLVLDWKTKCVRNSVTKNYRRYRQKRLLAKSTILDEYFKKLSEAVCDNF